MSFSQNISLKDGTLVYFPGFIDVKESKRFYDQLRNEIDFEQHLVTIFGKTYPTPRLESFHSDEIKCYGYSGNKLVSKPLTDTLKLLLNQVDKSTDSTFNCMLINLYRDGSDSNGWHADNETELGKNPIIASLSFGATRRFDLKHNSAQEKFSIDLHSGDLLWMDNRIQNFYKHQIVKTKKVMEPRINLTFRFIDEGQIRNY